MEFDLEADIPQQTIRAAPPPPTRIPLTGSGVSQQQSTGGSGGSPPAKVVRINPAAGGPAGHKAPVMPRLTGHPSAASHQQQGDSSEDGEEKPQTSPDSTSMQILQPKGGDVKSKSNEGGETSGDTQDPSVDSSEDTSEKKKRKMEDEVAGSSGGGGGPKSPNGASAGETPLSNSKKQKVD